MADLGTTSPDRALELAAVQQRYAAAERVTAELRAERLAAIRAARKAGLKQVEIARVMGVSPQRVEQLLHPKTAKRKRP